MKQKNQTPVLKVIDSHLKQRYHERLNNYQRSIKDNQEGTSEV